MTRRNIELAFSAAERALTDEGFASRLERHSAKGGIVFTDPSDAKLHGANRAMAKDLKARGVQVTTVSVRKQGTGGRVSA